MNDFYAWANELHVQHPLVVSVIAIAASVFIQLVLRWLFSTKPAKPLELTDMGANVLQLLQLPALHNHWTLIRNDSQLMCGKLVVVVSGGFDVLVDGESVYSELTHNDITSIKQAARSAARTLQTYRQKLRDEEIAADKRARQYYIAESLWDKLHGVPAHELSGCPEFVQNEHPVNFDHTLQQNAGLISCTVDDKNKCELAEKLPAKDTDVFVPRVDSIFAGCPEKDCTLPPPVGKKVKPCNCGCCD